MANKPKQISLPTIDVEENNWKEEWVGMPEYNNVPRKDPEVTITIKFSTRDDYLEFYHFIKKHMYGGRKPFDGRQRKNIKTGWYPPAEKASNYIYVGEDDES